MKMFMNFKNFSHDPTVMAVGKIYLLFLETSTAVIQARPSFVREKNSSYEKSPKKCISTWPAFKTGFLGDACFFGLILASSPLFDISSSEKTERRSLWKSGGIKN